MGLSKKELYNNALAKVTRKRVSSVDENTFEANTCNELYPKALNDACFEHSWSSLIKRVALVETSDSPVAAYDNSFQLPNDYIKLVNAYNSTSKDSFDFEWEIQGSLFLTNESTVYIKYVHLPSSPNIMNPPLTNVVAYKLAIALAFPMNAKPEREGQLILQYEQNALPRAKAQDSQESRYIEFEENPWIESLYDLSP